MRKSPILSYLRLYTLSHPTKKKLLTKSTNPEGLSNIMGLYSKYIGVLR